MILMHRKFWIPGALLVSGAALATWYFTHPRLEKLEAFGKFRVGDQAVGFAGHTEFGQAIGPNIPPGKFHVRLFTDKLPDHVNTTCLDQECGPVADVITRLGGHVEMTRDGKIPKLYGLKLVPARKRAWVFEHSLVIVESADSKILAIFKNAKFSNLAQIVKQANLEEVLD